jgi:arylsulfatase A-like enzyme
MQRATAPPGRRFLVSALVATGGSIVGEQAVLVFSSPLYFHTLGEWVWNVFVSTSFLCAFATLYGLAGGVCWQAMADHVDPYGRLARWLHLSRKPDNDQKAAVDLLAATVALMAYFASIFLLLLHISNAYSNKSLAAIASLIGIMLLLVPAIVVYALTKRLVRPVTALIERFLPGRVLRLELFLFCMGLVVLALVIFQRFPALWDVIDLRIPLVLISFLFIQWLIYRFLSTRLGASWTYSSSHILSLGGWLIMVAMMLAITIHAYPSQPHVAGILRHHAPISRPILIALQRLSDFDGDGFSSILRGGDCNDKDAAIHPMATDIPGNGIDEDCSGVDARALPNKKIKPDETLALRIAGLRRRYNVLLISIDAVRADHLGYMGYQRDTSPELDAFAKESIVFAKAYAIAPNTPQAIPGILSGRYPSQIEWASYTNFPKVKDETTLVHELFSRDGYYVAGIFPHWYFKQRNLERGADEWDTHAFNARDHSEETYTDDLVADSAIARLDQIKHMEKPFFLWVHFFDPHFLYIQHKGIYFGSKQIDRYDGELRFSSQQVGRLIDYVKRNPIYRDTIIIVLADHGEEFLEHGKRWHGSQLYEESIHVPLIVHIPGIKPRRVDRPVSLVNIAPTLTDLTGLEFSEAQGHSLAAMMLDPNQGGDTPVYIEKLRSPTFPWSQQALVSGRWKLIHRVDEQIYELYDLESNSHENRNLFEILPEKADEMLMRLEDFKAIYLQQNSGWYSLADGLNN